MSKQITNGATAKLFEHIENKKDELEAEFAILENDAKKLVGNVDELKGFFISRQ